MDIYFPPMIICCVWLPSILAPSISSDTLNCIALAPNSPCASWEDDFTPSFAGRVCGSALTIHCCLNPLGTGSWTGPIKLKPRACGCLRGKETCSSLLKREAGSPRTPTAILGLWREQSIENIANSDLVGQAVPKTSQWMAFRSCSSINSPCGWGNSELGFLLPEPESCLEGPMYDFTFSTTAMTSLWTWCHMCIPHKVWHPQLNTPWTDWLRPPCSGYCTLFSRKLWRLQVHSHFLWPHQIAGSTEKQRGV